MSTPSGWNMANRYCPRHWHPRCLYAILRNTLPAWLPFVGWAAANRQNRNADDNALAPNLQMGNKQRDWCVGVGFQCSLLPSRIPFTSISVCTSHPPQQYGSVYFLVEIQFAGRSPSSDEAAGSQFPPKKIHYQQYCKNGVYRQVL